MISRYQYLQDLLENLGAYGSVELEVVLPALYAFEDEFTAFKAKLSWRSFDEFAAFEEKLP